MQSMLPSLPGRTQVPRRMIIWRDRTDHLIAKLRHAAIPMHEAHCGAGRLSFSRCAKLLLKQVLLRMDLLVSGARSLFSSGPHAAADVPGVRHPYYPRDLLLPGYQPLLLPYEGILTAFFGAAAVIFACTWAASGTQPTPQQTLLHFQQCLWYGRSSL